jgi:heme/copper-type cytochrome/quinol oxidase subunit 3
MIRRPRVVVDVSVLPDSVFGNRDILWWGTLGFVVIEGFTLVLCAMAYVYLMQNFAAWPPENTPLPSLGAPTANVVLMLASLPLAVWVHRSAKRYELGRVRLGLTVCSVLVLVFVALRLVELIVSLNVKWNTNAYGSAQWLVVGSHATLLLIQAVEVIGIAAMFWIAPLERKHFSDAADAMFYWYFMVLAWVPLYVLCYLIPRWVT